MKSQKKQCILVLDTSAIFSMKLIDVQDVELVTSQKVVDEITPGGRDHRFLQFLFEKGLSIYAPDKESIKKVIIISEKTGDLSRLSETDIEILALTIQLGQVIEDEAILVTDDYSIQNVASALNLKYLRIDQRGITKRFKWSHRCSGCGKTYDQNLPNCPVCGSKMKSKIIHKKQIKKWDGKNR